MERKVLCPVCGLSNDFVSPRRMRCRSCGNNFEITENDFQNVKFIEINDGYHSWQSQPTAYHTIYACLSYPDLCNRCIHKNDLFCQNGKIDFRQKRST